MLTISLLAASSGRRGTNTRQAMCMNFSRKEMMFTASRRLTIKAVLPGKYPAFQFAELLSIILLLS